MIKPGYKQTEVGVIPEDWLLPKIKDLCTLINGRGFKPYEWEDQGLPIIRIQNLNGSDEFNYFSGSYNPKIFVEHNQLLFAWSGSKGTSFGPHIWKGGNALLNYHTWKLATDQSKIDNEFFYHALKLLTKNIEDKAHGASALVHTQKGEMEEFYIPIPPSKKEQCAIAEALADVDGLLAGLDKLIAKKRAIKTATMQQLLTGKTRLPGFGEGQGYKQTEVGVIPGDWEVTQLIDVLKKPPQYGINAPSVTFQGDLPVYIRITDISEEGYFTPETVVSVDHPSSDQYYLEEDDLVFARTGASVGKSYLYNPSDGKLVFAGFLIRVKPDKNKLLPTFLAQYVKTGAYWKWVQLMSMRSGQPGINGNEYGKLPLPHPPLPEQRAIAQILTDMDAEITALETRRAKTEAIKQGMMQELLTGKTRLVDS